MSHDPDIARDTATVIAEAQNGIAPPLGALALDDSQTATTGSRSFRTTALIVACALFMQNLDSTILATALPTMARDFAVPPTGIGLALTSYLLALAIFIPASGTTADRFGARRVFKTAIGVFVLGSLACGLSPNLEALVAARFFQGIGGAMMVPVGRLVLLRSVAKRNLVSAMSWLAMPALVGPILGPPVGGMIVSYLDWRWIFWINLPMGVLGMILVGRFIDDVRTDGVARFDGKGFILSGIALGMLLFGLQLASRAGHARIAAVLIASGLIGSLFYIRHARSTSYPLLDLTLMRVPTFCLAVVGGTLIRIMQGAQPFLLPMLMQLAFGLSAAASGGITVATAIGSFAMKSVARPLLKRFGFRTSLTTIGLLAPAGYAVAGLFRPGWPFPAIFAVLLVCGFLTSLQFTAYNTIAYDEIAPTRMSAATSFYATFQQIALSLGVCLASSALTLSMRLRGHALPRFSDFSAAIWLVTGIAATAVVANSRFARDAGAELSGHRAH